MILCLEQTATSPCISTLTLNTKLIVCDCIRNQMDNHGKLIQTEWRPVRKGSEGSPGTTNDSITWWSQCISTAL